MNEKQICDRLRPEFGKVGLALLSYYGIMNVAVALVCMIHAFVLIFPYLLTDPELLESETSIESILDSVINNGWGYLLATLIGAVLLLVWKRKQFCFHEIWKQQKPIKAGSFFMLLTIFISAQALVQLMTVWMEWFFGLFDISVMDALEEISVTGDTLSMFLYMAIAAPVFEEVIFRGFVLRTLQPYGRRFAILCSAFLFGIFHGNILQTPFAFVVGLILGYITVEYSIVWAILLHTINNLILGDTLPRITQLLPPWIGELIFALIIWGCFLGAVIILIIKRKQVFDYFTGPKIHSVKKKMLNTLIKGIDIATELGLYVIVDWHMVGAENVLDKNPLTYLEESKEFFSYISEYYKDQDNILYEIMNEPNGSTTWADCKKYANEVIPCIRKNTDAIILVGNPKWTADLNSVMKDPLTGYKNIMYTYHFYAADHSNTTQVSSAYDKGFPVFISEFGFMESSGDGSISKTNGDKWKKVLDSRNISYVAWNISNSKGSASIFKYNTSNLSDVSDSNLKEWGVYLKNWYKSKASNSTAADTNNNNNNTYDQTIIKVDFQLVIEVEEETGYLQCFINTPGFETSRLKYDWTSSNENVLTVSEYSTISIVGDGKCSIICIFPQPCCLHPIRLGI